MFKAKLSAGKKTKAVETPDLDIKKIWKKLSELFGIWDTIDGWAMSHQHHSEGSGWFRSSQTCKICMRED